MSKRRREKMKAKEQRHDRERKTGVKPGDPAGDAEMHGESVKPPTHIRHASREWKEFYKTAARFFS